ncbi:MAG: hypothetical protein ABIQ16_18425 [Polyangiaceae bacterium]
MLYEGLVTLAPTLDALVGRVAAVAEARGPETGWRILQTVPRAEATSYQPYWAVAAHLLKGLKRNTEAIEAYERASGLCEDTAMRAFLREQRRRL